MSKARQVPARRETRAHQRKILVDRYVRLGLISLAVVVVGILAVGVYRVAIAAPNEPIALVAGHKITTRQYQARVRYNRLNVQAQISAVQEQMSSVDTTDSSAGIVQQLLQQQLTSLQSAAMSLPLQTMEDMIDEELVRQEAQRRGIAASSDEVERQIEKWFGYNLDTPTSEPTLAATETPLPTTPTVEATAVAAATTTATADGTATPEVTPEGSPTYTVLLSSGTAVADGTAVATDTPGPTPTPWPTSTPTTQEGYESLRADYLAYVAKQSGISAANFQAMMEVQVLRDELQPLLKAEVPTSAPQVHIRQILVSSQAEADKAMARVVAGEDFATVAAEVSLDESAAEGGDMGWASEWDTAFNSTVYARALEMAVGERAIVATWEGYHVVELIEKSDDRPLAESALEERSSGALDAWLEEQSQTDSVKRYWSSDKVPLESTSQ